MALWEYKVITSGKGGFATPALLESYLNQLGGEDWEIIEFRTQPDNPLAFSGLARRPTQRDWTLEAAAAAAARAEADKLRAEFAAKFQAATKSPEEALKVDESGNPVRDDSFRRPRDTEYDQDPYALDDSSSEEPEEIPAEDQLPTFFEAVRPHMRRNQKGPGYSVGLEYILKKFDMLEDDLVQALKEIGFEIPEDEDDKPVYIEYDGDVYWVNINRRGELWINTREKPRAVFKVTKGNRLSPEEASPEQVPAEQEHQASNQQRQPQHQNRRNERNEQRQRRHEAEQAAAVAAGEGSKEETPVAAEPASEGATQEKTQPEKPQKEQAPAAPLPSGVELLERLRPMMRRSRGGWSGTISYLSRAMRQSDADLVAALAQLGLVAPATSGEKAPVVESGPFAYWLNKDGRGGIWINVREARRMRHEERGEAAAAGEQDSGTKTEAVPAPSAEAVVAAPAVEAGQETPVVSEPAAEAPVAEITPAPVAEVPVSVPEPAPQPSPSAVVEPVSSEAPSITLPLAGVRLLLKEQKSGSFAGETSHLASQLEKSEEAFVAVLVQTGLKVPEKAREKPVFVEHAGEVFWLNRNAKGELWLNAKPSKYSRKDASEDGEAEAGEDEGASEKKPRRAPRGRKKSESEETPSEPGAQV